MYEYKCKLVKVVDGDTIDIDIDLGFGVWMQNQRIRMYGIDTPESRTSDDVEKIYGNAAKDFLIKWTNSGNLTLKTFKDDPEVLNPIERPLREDSAKICLLKTSSKDISFDQAVSIDVSVVNACAKNGCLFFDL